VMLRALKTRILILLVGLRVVLAPTLVAVARYHPRGVFMVMIVWAGLLSDVYDGILARRIGVETTALRRADSVADTIFYAAAGLSAWLVAPRQLIEVRGLLIALIVLEAVRYAFDWMKFKREASYHAYSAKAWGLVLAVALTLLFGFRIGGFGLQLALIVGIVADLEGIAISVLLPGWAHDVRTVVHAWRLRQKRASLALP
jgi:phosphatidylglycerophosphate synthase